jgi:hypothetical protein
MALQESKKCSKCEAILTTNPDNHYTYPNGSKVCHRCADKARAAFMKSIRPNKYEIAFPAINSKGEVTGKRCGQTFKTLKQAIAAAKKQFGSDDEGRLSIVRRI